MAVMLAEIIHDAGKTQTEIAALFSVTDSTVSRWCSGRHQLPSEYITPLAAFLNVSVEDLVRALDATRKTAVPSGAA